MNVVTVQVPYAPQIKGKLQNAIKLPYYFILRECGPRRMLLAGRRHKRFISHIARRWARGTITSLIPALKRFIAFTVRRACFVIVPVAERTWGPGIARAVVATLPAVAAAVCRHSGGRCGATARCSRPARSIHWPWKFQPLSTGGGTQVARHRAVNHQHS